MERFARQVRQGSRNLGVRLVALYLLLLLIPVAGIGLFGHFYLQNTLVTAALTAETTRLVERAASLDDTLGHVQDDLTTLAQLLAAIGTGPAGIEGVEAFVAAHDLYRSATLLTAEGDVIGGSPSRALTTWLATDAFASTSAQEPFSVRFFPWSFDSAPFLIVAARLADEILLLEVDARILLGQPAGDATDEGWRLVAGDDVFVYGQAGATGPLPLDALADGRAGYLVRGDVVHFFGPTGPVGSWSLVRSIPLNTIYPDLTTYTTIFAILLVGGLTTVAGLALFAISRFLEPLYQLEGMVDRMRQGDPRPGLPAPLPRDEFGKAMLAFDEMAAEIESRRRTERALMAQLIHAQEEERKLIAYDLHDGLIQQLVGARLYLGQARRQCDAQANPDALRHIETGYDVLTQAIADGRRIIQGLHPTVLEELGLEAALTELATAQAEAAGLAVTFDIQPIQPQPDRATRVTLYRITQEALNNVVKHAQAGCVSLHLALVDGMIHLRIRDDGRGFEPARVLQNGQQRWGIRTMCERATMLQATCEIDSRPGAGTTVTVRAPYRAEDDQP